MRLDQTHVTDAGLKYLKKMTSVRRLFLRKTCITDGGLEHIKALSKLETLDVSETSVTDKGVQDLERSLPKLTIIHKGIKGARTDSFGTWGWPGIRAMP